jgi:flagellar basal body rod protein FlgG
MDPISIVAASGLRARMQSLDLIANKLANASTSGYKSDSEFYSLFASEDADSGSLDVQSTQPWIKNRWTDFSQGTLEPTNNPLDLALDGPGLFAVEGGSYTRTGSFRVSPAGTLTTQQGKALVDQNGQPITVDPSLPIEVGSDGSVSQGGQQVAQFRIVNFPLNAQLAKEGNNYFRPVDPKLKPAPATGTQVKQGVVEGSNVKTPEAAVHLIGIMRQFEMLQKAISISNDMGKQAVQEVARVGS